MHVRICEFLTLLLVFLDILDANPCEAPDGRDD